MYKSQGNWAEDLGHDMELLVKFGLFSVIAIPVLTVVGVVQAILLRRKRAPKR